MSTASNISSPCHRCQGCGRREPTASRLLRSGTIRRFGSACQTLLRRASTKAAKLAWNPRHREQHNENKGLTLQDDQGTSQFGTPDNPAELPADTSEFVLAELDSSQEIYEIDSVEEVQGLLAGVQYLDTMNDIAHQKASPPPAPRISKATLFDFQTPNATGFPATERPQRSEAFNPRKQFDFTNAETFRFLDEAISSSPPTASWSSPLRRSNAIRDPRTSSVAHSAARGSSVSIESENSAPPATNESPPADLTTAICDLPENFDSFFPLSPQSPETPPSANSRKRQKRPRRRSKSQSTETAPERPEHRSPRNAQWITLWKLRYDLRELYSRLMDATNDPTFPRANKVRRLFRDATHMLQVGLSTFLDVLNGTVPTTLQKIMAFVFVSTVMWNAVNRHKTDSQRNPLSEIHIWRSAIHDTKDRTVLDRVIHALLLGESSPSESTNSDGPGDPNQTTPDLPMDWDLTDVADLATLDTSFFQFLDMDNSDLTRASLFDCTDGQPGSADGQLEPESLLQSFQSEVGHLLTETSSFDDIRFADFLNIPGLEDILPPSSGHPGLHIGPRCSGQYNNYPQRDVAPDESIMEPTGAAVESQMGGLLPWDNLSLDPQWLGAAWTSPSQSLDETGTSQIGGHLDLTCKSSSDGEVSSGRVLVSCLVGSVLFQAVVAFLRYLGGPGAILHILSGCSEARLKREPPDDSESETNESLLGYPSVVMGDFFAELSRLVIEPLRIVFQGGCSQLLGLLAMAEAMAKSGSIRTLRAFEDYLIHAGQHLSNCRSGYMFLVKSILAQCLRCSSTMTWDHVYGDSVSENEEYSEHYVSIRESREQDLANSIFVVSVLTETGFPGHLLEDASDENQSQTLALMAPPSAAPVTTSPSAAPRKIARCPHEGCTKEYKGIDARVNLRRHIRCAHESDSAKAFTCPGAGCDLQTPRRDNLRNHFLKKHAGEEMPAWLMDKKRSRAAKS